MALSPSLFQVSPIDEQLFFSLKDDELLRQVHRRFPQELECIKRAYSIIDRRTARPLTPSPSQVLYNAQYNEVNRTLVSVLCLRWIWRNQYETFTGTQPAMVLLLRSSFDWMREIFIRHLQTATDLYTLLMYIVINDLGKDPYLASGYFSMTGEDVSAFNHDIILYKAAQAGLIPCYNDLPEEQKNMVKLGIQLGAEFNVGQLAQAENAPVCLASLEIMKGHEDAFHLHFMQQLLDVSGAAGHEDWTCAKKAIQPICDAYCNVYGVALDVISGKRSLREAYDVILIRRGQMLHEKGLQTLDVQSPQDRALLRLLCMGGISDLETARLYESVWRGLEEKIRSSLVDSLNVDGSADQPAIQPTYMPAMLAQGVGETSSSSPAELARRLQCLLHYLERVMHKPATPDGRVTVIERSVLWVVKNVVQADGFRDNPEILETVALPDDAVAMVVYER